MDSNKIFDIAIVGAGAYGAAMAYEASTRGLTTFLADKGDFGSGTSSNSLKIVHGGLRYLQDFNVVRARYSAIERSVFLRIAPDLVSPLQCVIPTGPGRGRMLMAAGLALNAAVTIDRNRALLAGKHLRAGGIVSRSELARLAHGLQMDGVTGGAMWHDAVMLDSERLSLAMVMSARKSGASVHNYLSVERLLKSGGTARGLVVRDEMTGSEHEIRARVVVSCQGPWALADSAKPCGPIGGDGLIRAVNLVLPNSSLGCAVGFPPRDAAGGPRNERLLFAVPWQGQTIVGTWYFPVVENQDPSIITAEELDFMLEELNSGFDSWKFERKDVRMFHIGQLPAQPTKHAGPEPITGPTIAETSEFGGLRGAWVVQGEKWCMARRTAQNAVELIAGKCGFELSRSVSSRAPLTTGPKDLVRCIPMSDDQTVGIPLDRIESLKYSLRHEMVRTLSDLVLRRTNIGAGGRPSAIILEQLANLAASELGWNETDKLRNIDSIHRHRLYPDDLIRNSA